MDKVKALVLLCIFLFSCQEESGNFKDFMEEGYDLKFGSLYNNLEYSLCNDSLKASYNNRIFFQDTILLSMDEKNIIASKFYKLKIYEFRDWVTIFGNDHSFPRRDDRIRVYQGDQLLASIDVNPKYVSEDILPDNSELAAVEFRNEIIEILLKRNKYKLLNDSIAQMRKRQPIFLY